MSESTNHRMPATMPDLLDHFPPLMRKPADVMLLPRSFGVTHYSVRGETTGNEKLPFPSIARMFIIVHIR